MSDDAGALGADSGPRLNAGASPRAAIMVFLRLQAPGTALGARVYSQCWMPFGERRQICCEQIEITAPMPRSRICGADATLAGAGSSVDRVVPQRPAGAHGGF